MHSRNRLFVQIYKSPQNLLGPILDDPQLGHLYFSKVTELDLTNLLSELPVTISVIKTISLSSSLYQ